MRDTQTFLLPHGNGLPGIGPTLYGVIATPDVSTYEELHGPFKSYAQADLYVMHLQAKYSQYSAFRIVKIETPKVEGQ